MLSQWVAVTVNTEPKANVVLHRDATQNACHLLFHELATSV